MQNTTRQILAFSLAARRAAACLSHRETDSVEGLEDLRRFISPENGPLVSDIELYHALPDKLRGHVWAEYVE